MVLKTVKYQIIENNSGNATHTKLSVIYSIFGIVFYSKVYTRPIRNEHSLEVQKVKELIFANEIQVNAQIRELKIKDLNTIEQVNKLIDSKISANNQHLKYDIWELGLKLENKLKLNTIVTVSQQKQANEQIEQQFEQKLSVASQQNEQIISANEQILATAKIYTCANCAKTFDNCRKYAGHKTHCR